MKKTKILITLLVAFIFTKTNNLFCAAVATEHDPLEHLGPLERNFLRTAQHGPARDLLSKFFLENVDANVTDSDGNTALMLAARNGQVHSVKLLLIYKQSNHETRSNVNHVNNEGETALILASRYNHPEIVEDLLTREDINVRAVDKNGWDALMWAAEQGNANVVAKLLAYKQDDPIERIDINYINHDGETALMLAAKNGHNEVVRLLLEARRHEDSEPRGFRIDVNQRKMLDHAKGA